VLQKRHLIRRSGKQILEVEQGLASEDPVRFSQAVEKRGRSAERPVVLPLANRTKALLEVEQGTTAIDAKMWAHTIARAAARTPAAKGLKKPVAGGGGIFGGGR
jgi:hypothetical protein